MSALPRTAAGAEDANPRPQLGQPQRPLLEENTDPTAAGDLHEAFDIAHERPDGGDPRHFGPNQWPRPLLDPVFLGSNPDALLEALPGCAGPERPAKYEPVLAGDYVQSRFDATYAYRRDNA